MSSSTSSIYLSLGKESIAGASAGVLGTLLGYPLDTIKTRMQISSTSLFNSVKIIYKENSIKGFYYGITSPFISLTILNTLNFTLYSYNKNNILLTKSLEITNKKFEWRYGMAGAMVGPFSSIISTPFELVKTQMQLSKKIIDSHAKLSLQSSASATSISTSELIAASRNSLTMAAFIFKKYGLQGLYHGHFVNTSREMVFLSTYFTTYEHFHTYINEFIKNNSSLSSINNNYFIPLAGGLSGALGWIISLPLDNLKSNIQSNLLTGQKKESAYVIFKRIIQTKGFFNLYKGGLPSVLRACIVSATRFSAYEFTIKTLTNRGW